MSLFPLDLHYIDFFNFKVKDKILKIKKILPFYEILYVSAYTCLHIHIK